MLPRSSGDRSSLVLRHSFVIRHSCFVISWTNGHTISRILDRPYLRDHAQHAYRVDAPESFLCPACFRPALDRQLDLHGAVFVSAGVSNPERRLAGRDVDFYFVAGDRRDCAAASSGHRRPHRLHDPRQTCTCSGKSPGSFCCWQSARW